MTRVLKQALCALHIKLGDRYWAAKPPRGIVCQRHLGVYCNFR